MIQISLRSRCRKGDGEEGKKGEIATQARSDHLKLKERIQNRATLAILLARQNYKLASRGELALFFFSELTMLREKRVISIRKNLS